MGKKYLHTIQLVGIYKELQKLDDSQTKNLLKWASEMNRHFSQKTKFKWLIDIGEENTQTP